MVVLCCLFALTTNAQQTEANLLVDYNPQYAFQEQLPTVTKNALQELLDNIPPTEKIVHIELIAHADDRHMAELYLMPIVDFLEDQAIVQQQIEAVTQIDDEHKVHIKLTSTVVVEQNITAQAVPSKRPTAKKIYCAGASQKAQVFSIAPKSNIDIKAKEGTQLRINRADLVYEDGQAVQEAIQVELKEFYSPQAILLADLHTMEGDKALETGGMLNLKITAQGKPLQLKKGKRAQLRMPAEQAKRKKGMNLYLGKRLENGAVDWRLEKRKEPVIAQQNVRSSDFDPQSYVKLKKEMVIDSISYKKKIHVKIKDATTHYPNFSKQRVVHQHEEEYFDLELPYFNPNIVDGVWVNVDKRLRDPFSPAPVDIMVQVKGIPSNGFNIDGQPMSYTPKVALMLKSRSVFLRGTFVAEDSKTGQQYLKFEDVPQNEEVVLVAFLDTGMEQLLGTKECTALKNMDEQILEIQPMVKTDFDAAMASLAH